MKTLRIILFLGIFFNGIILPYTAQAHEGESHVEHSQKHPPQILILATRHVRESKLRLFSKLAKEDGRFIIEYQYSKNIEKDASLEGLVAPYDLVIFDGLSASEASSQFVKFESVINDKRIYLPIKATGKSILRSRINLEQAKTVYDYYHSGGSKNISRLVTYLGTTILQLDGDKAKPPIVFAESGIYHPDYENVVFPSIAEFINWRGEIEQKTPAIIGLALGIESIAAGDTAVADALIAEIKKRGGVAVAYYYPSRSDKAQVNILTQNNQTFVDVIINTKVIHLAAKRKQEFTKLGVPVLQAIPYNAGTQSEWEDFQGGIPSSTTPFYLTLPEIAGAIDPVITSAKDKQGSVMPIDYQINMVVERAFNHAKLTRKANADKKIALMFYNYPPGEKSAGASFLNVPRSIDSILQTLETEGYSVEDHAEDWFIDKVGCMLQPYYHDKPLSNLSGVGKPDGDAGLLPVTRYNNWFKTLPKHIREAINKEWGSAENAFSVAKINGEKQFVIPRVITGNVTILPQPPRGSRAEQESKIFHDKSIPVSHHYLAVYFYAREQFGADAIIHLGTHGSQEWLPGKERGLSRYDAGNLAIGNTPVIYPYIMDDVGEALQAKRRGRATMISHLTPPMSESGLYSELSDMHDLMHQYGQLEEGMVKSKTKVRIIDAVLERNLHEDMNWNSTNIDTNFPSFLVELHGWLSELSNEIQPLGLHTFGELPKQEYLISTIVLMLGDRFSELALEHAADYLGEIKSTRNESHSHEANDSDEANDSHEANHSHDGGSVHSHNNLAIDEHDEDIKSHEDFTRLKETFSYRLVEKFIFSHADISNIKQDELRLEIERGREYLQGFEAIEEHQALIDALNGKYVQPTTGGDPVRHPEALPTGRNLYGFDPSKMPTKSAWEAGKNLTDTMIADYHRDNGVYPDKIAYSLWAIEAMRHLGVIESQAMAAMGVRPVWNDAGYVKGTEIIPYSELKRPRVDVVLSITGLYRDALPNLVQLLASAAEDVAALHEDNNYVRLNALRLKDELIAEGMDIQQASDISVLRVFSNESGTYGTGLANATLTSGSWEKDDRLADMYLSRMGYAYGKNDKTWSQDLRDIKLYSRNLSGTDAAVFSRTSNVYGLLTSDDPFQYMGSLSLAVRRLDGKSPKMYISNLRNTNKMRAEDLGQFLSRELRTRQFHPQWISTLQQEGYAGTLVMLDSLNNFWGWQVVDPQNVRADQWQDFFEVYVQDKYELELREWFEQANPHALAQMLERMLEAVRKEYWNADTATIKEMLDVYIELANQYDVPTSNTKFKEYVQAQAAGYGLALLSPESTNTTLSGGAAQQAIQGQVLEKVQPKTTQEHDFTWLLLLMTLLLPFFVGVIKQIRVSKNSI